MLSRLCAAFTLAGIALVSTGSGPAGAQDASAGPKRPLVFVPGLLGSRLCRADPADPAEPVVVWGTAGALSQFPTTRLEGTPADAEITSCGLIREIVYLGLFTQEVYAPVIEHLESLGYREDETLFVFDYDWRQSVFTNAERLAGFVRAKVPDEGQQIDILAHSMGGLIARVYAVKHGGAARLARLISAGTPFQGSVKVFATLEEGWGTMNVLMGGLTAFRETVLSFPSTFELMPRYGGCCEGAGSGTPGFEPADANAWLALAWDGIDSDTLPDLTQAAARQRELHTIVAAGLPAGSEDITVVGVDQRTPQHFALEANQGGARLRLKTTWAGDGTVVRESAILPHTVVHPTSFSDHEHILGDEQVQEFLGVTLTRGVDEAIRTVPVRPRSRIRTAWGKVTELVGVAVETAEPIQRAGEQSTVTVHVRLGVQEPLAPEKVRLTLRDPNGRERAIALRPDPSASDPTNPFEQSFVGRFDTGAIPGNATFTAEILVDGSEPRIAQRTLPVLAR